MGAHVAGRPGCRRVPFCGLRDDAGSRMHASMRSCSPARTMTAPWLSRSRLVTPRLCRLRPTGPGMSGSSQTATSAGCFRLAPASISPCLPASAAVAALARASTRLGARVAAATSAIDAAAASAQAPRVQVRGEHGADPVGRRRPDAALMSGDHGARAAVCRADRRSRSDAVITLAQSADRFAAVRKLPGRHRADWDRELQVTVTREHRVTAVRGLDAAIQHPQALARAGHGLPVPSAATCRASTPISAVSARLTAADATAGAHPERGRRTPSGPAVTWVCSRSRPADSASAAADRCCPRSLAAV